MQGLKSIFNIKHTTSKIFSNMLSFITGGTECIVCGKNCIAIPICKECGNRFFSVPDINEKFCPVCGKTLISEQNICTDCRSRKIDSNIDRIFPLFSYRLWNTRLLSAWKFNEERVLSPFFAEKIAERLLNIQAYYGKFYIVPVPPRHGKIRERGWDQIEDLCKILEYSYGFKILRMLQRISDTEQKKLDRRERLSTIGKSYALRKDSAKIALPEQVCIIDDVITTGATIQSCAAALKSAGVKKIFALALFTVD